MRNLLLILVIYFMVASCNKDNNDDPKNTIPPELIGKWKAVEIYSTDGGSPATWSTYDSGRDWDKWFKSDGTYSLSYPYTDPDCMGGTYSVSDNDITYGDNPCTDGTPVTIEILTENELLINANHFEAMKTKYIKVF